MTVAAPPAASLPLPLKLFHGLGSIAYGIKDNGFSTFLLLFYNQVLGLDAGLVGAVIMAALIADAFADPVIGELTDRTNSRWGRRLPWLYLAPVPLFFAWLALWNPPVMGDAGLVAWLFVWAIVVRTLVSACEVPSVALVPELTGDYDERTALMRFRFLFGWAGGLVALFLAYGVFLKGDGTGAGGLTARDGYAGYALFGACAMTLAVLVSAAGQHRRIARPSPPRAPSAPGLRVILGEMRHTLSNRAFLLLLAAGLFGFVNQGITFSLSNYLIAFLWRLEGNELTTYALLLFASVVVAFVIVTPLSRRLGKKRAAIVAGVVSLGINSALYAVWLADWFPGGDQPAVAPFFAVILAANAFSVCLMILTSSMMADVVEASQAETGRRSEGLFFAGYFFMQKCATGLGIFVAGLILSFAAFPQGATPGAVDGAVIDRIALYYMLALLVIGLTGLWVLRRFPISRADHDARLSALAVTESGRTPDAA